MNQTNPYNREVSLQEVLDNREARVERQRAMLLDECALISFTVNMPGPRKDTETARLIFRAGLAAIREAVERAALTVTGQAEAYLPTGPEALVRVVADAAAVKRLTVGLEETHDLGRLLDMDVLGPDGVSVSRADLGLRPRSCLICGKPAAGCARSRAHGIEELVERIENMVAASRT